MHEAQSAQFADLALVDGGLEAEVELVEGLDVGQMGQLQPRLEIALPPGIGFGVHHLPYVKTFDQFDFSLHFDQRQPDADAAFCA